jgi:hypothetical protein
VRETIGTSASVRHSAWVCRSVSGCLSSAFVAFARCFSVLGPIGQITTDRSHITTRQVIRLVFSCIFLLLTAATPARAQEDLIGLKFGRIHIESVLVIKSKGDFWLPIKETARSFSIEPLEKTSQGTKIATPLGITTIPPSDTKAIQGVEYFNSRYLMERLGGKLAFDTDEGVLAVTLPWRPGSAIETGGTNREEVALEAEVVPPGAGMSTLHGEAAIQHGGNSRTRHAGNLRAAGHAYGGVWQVNYQEDLGSFRSIRDAVWMKSFGPHHWVQIGHQTTTVHPLLHTVEFSGAQIAWTNAPEIRKDAYLQPGIMIGRWSQTSRSFEGTGPVGAYAELWVDGLVLSQTYIGLDQVYRFENVALPARQSSVEVRVYERRGAATPVKIVRKTVNLSELMLDQGQAVVVSGGGYGGNVFDDLIGSSSHAVFTRNQLYEGRPAISGFAFARYAPIDWITLEAGVTVARSVPRAMLGGIARLSDEAVGSLAIGVGEDSRFSYLAELSWQRDAWKLVAKSFRRGEFIAVEPSTALNTSNYGLTTTYDPDWDHHIDLNYAFGSHLDVGIIARAQPEAKFVLPYARWRPTPNLSLELQPDQRGNYRFDGRYRISKSSDLFAIAHRSAQALTYIHRFESGLTMSAEIQRSDFYGWRAGLGFAGNDLFDMDIKWNAIGYYGEHSDFSLQGGLSKAVAPGIELFAEAYRQFDTGQFNTGIAPGELRVRVGLRFNIGFSQNGLVEAAHYGISSEKGALAGNIRSAASYGPNEFGGIPVLLNGTEAGRTRKDGSFYIPNVDKGVHVVSIDEEKLPIEHVPQKSRIAARVAPGAVTTLALTTDVEYGVAGQVTSASSQPVADAEIVVSRPDGQEVGRTSTNQFGYYRADGLRRGNYTLKVVGKSGETLAQRSLSVTSEFLFGADLQLAL